MSLIDRFSSIRSNDPGRIMADNRDKTTRKIALWLLFTFVTSIFVLFLTNIFIFQLVLGKDGKEIDPDFRKGWFDMLKSSLVLLGSALTTVIGYYFGQREGEKKAEQAEKTIQATDAKAQEAVEQATRQRDDVIRETAASNSGRIIDDIPSQENNTIQLPDNQ